MTFGVYNKFSGYSSLTYNIVRYLINNNEDIWKILKYNTPDALDLPQLTNNEKRDLIYNGEEDAEDQFRVFRDIFTDDTQQDRVTQLRIFPSRYDSDNKVNGIVDIIFQVVTHVKVNYLDNYTTRIDYLTEQLIKTLNGEEIDGVGKLFMDGETRRTNGTLYTPSVGNNKNYEGIVITMSCHLFGGDGC